MADQDSDSASVLSVGEGGIAADHIPVESAPVLVATTQLASEFNLLRNGLIPFACWRAHDMRFAFGSSFVKPEIKKEMAALKRLIDRHTVTGSDGKPARPGMSVFGHADPTGSDDFNKTLSGRRAQAIYGLLVRDTALWEDLYSTTWPNDAWEPDAIFAMQDALGLPQSSHPSAGDRKTLFASYMDLICTSTDSKGRTTVMLADKADFLGAGADAKGKGDYQGCGEFNPLVIFSQSQTQAFADPSMKDARDAENERNRRVLIFLFRPGVRITPSAWPCPRAKEGSAGCKKRFWSDGENRRTSQLPDDERKFDDTADTFACRFYHRLAVNSPCEQILKNYTLKLFDQKANPLPFAICSVVSDGVNHLARADADAVVTVHDLKVPTTANVRWSPAADGDDADSPDPAPDETFVFEITVFVGVPEEDDDDDEIALQRLHNMGYVGNKNPEDDIADFQSDYRSELPDDTLKNQRGKLDGPTLAAIRKFYNSTTPLVKKLG